MFVELVYDLWEYSEIYFNKNWKCSFFSIVDKQVHTLVRQKCIQITLKYFFVFSFSRHWTEISD